ncbi:MAG: hypothetical protein AAB721_00190 [Patescibacteria group bacterium]
MIITRAPMRISFVGGGTDFPDFYDKYPGRCISATIDQYVYIVINPTPLVDKISARYSISETVDTPDEIKNTRIKAALKYWGIEKGIEIGSFATLPSNIGLGSSSSFSCALMKALAAYKKVKLNSEELAKLACKLEIDLVGEPIGKQDQYAAAYGGLNFMEFDPDSIKITQLGYDFFPLEDHLLLFFTGIRREASEVLKKHKENIEGNFDLLKSISDSVLLFPKLLSGNYFEEIGKLLDYNWKKKKGLVDNISNEAIDRIYEDGLNAGAWGGKLLGAGNGGCVLFVVPPAKKAQVREKLKHLKEIPIKFVRSGTDILYDR